MSLILESPDSRQRLALSIAGYQFPDPWHTEYSSRTQIVPHATLHFQQIVDGPPHEHSSRANTVPHETDWNWLRVLINARHGDLAWSAENAALLTWEVEWLADWLEALALGRTTETLRDFLEPCLAFRAEPQPDGLTRIRVYFGYELYPPGRLGPVADESDVYLEFDLTYQQLQAAVRALRGELSRYPARPW